MPVDHGHLEAIRKPDAGGFTDLIAPPKLQCRKNNYNSRREYDHDRGKRSLFEGEFHDASARNSHAGNPLPFEFVTESLHRKDELWLLWVIFQFLAQAGNVHVHGPCIHVGAIAPDLFQ